MESLEANFAKIVTIRIIKSISNLQSRASVNSELFGITLSDSDIWRDLHPTHQVPHTLFDILVGVYSLQVVDCTPAQASYHPIYNISLAVHATDVCLLMLSNYGSTVNNCCICQTIVCISPCELCDPIFSKENVKIKNMQQDILN